LTLVGAARLTDRLYFWNPPPAQAEYNFYGPVLETGFHIVAVAQLPRHEWVATIKVPTSRESGNMSFAATKALSSHDRILRSAKHLFAEIGYENSREYPQIAEYFAHIRQQANRAASLTRELLAFARRQALQPRPLDLNRIIENLMSFLDKVIGKDIEIRFRPGEILAIKADPAQVEQVLMNICLNARDAMPNGGVLKIQTELVLLDEVFCQFRQGATPGMHVVLTIADTGTGMSIEVRERIFEPFFTTKEPSRGTGMGLATVYGIVRQHGGFIDVFSELGNGTLFHVYWPVTKNAATEPVSSLGIEVPPRKLSGSETILFAEDHDSIREMVRQSLGQLGYHVLAGADGIQALALAERYTPDLAILDLMMPQMGGAAAARKLREKFQSLPIVFTSGFAEDANQVVAQLPGSQYLQKPYSPNSLARVIREIMNPKSESGI